MRSFFFTLIEYKQKTPIKGVLYLALKKKIVLCPMGWL